MTVVAGHPAMDGLAVPSDRGERPIEGLRTLDGEQLYVVAGIIDGATEREIAEELSASRQRENTRERVHRIKLTAYAKLRRAVSA